MAISLSNNKHTANRVRARLRRQARGRKRISGTAERPRLVVTRSARHITVQVVDDLRGATLASGGPGGGAPRPPPPGGPPPVLIAPTHTEFLTKEQLP